ncbi:MAG: hypothetical protein LBK50_03720 [Candidatus Nomurabacteria bacterium]|jgi:hypothetical protein|nr:hypothetical protein [Candidatus Nomurabacteria bacterium]
MYEVKYDETNLKAEGRTKLEETLLRVLVETRNTVICVKAPNGVEARVETMHGRSDHLRMCYSRCKYVIDGGGKRARALVNESLGNGIVRFFWAIDYRDKTRRMIDFEPDKNGFGKTPKCLVRAIIIVLEQVRPRRSDELPSEF